MKKISLLFLSLIFASLALFSQEKSNKAELNVGADLASAYLWRGFSFGDSPALQPWGELSYKGFSVGTWGSYDFSGSFQEVDLYAKYSFKNFSVLFIDLFFPGLEFLDQNFYNFENETTGHSAEIGLSFDGTEKIPFSVYGGVLIYGLQTDPKTDDPEKNNYSTYFEVNYNGKLKDYTYNVFTGFTLSESPFYQTSGFSIFNVGVSGTRTLKITQDFSVPMKLSLVTNPAIEKIYLALLLSF